MKGYYDSDPCACGTNKAAPDGFCHFCRGGAMRDEGYECNKLRWSEKGAQEALARSFKKITRGQRQECRIYYCEGCAAYHLTSQPERD